jgi:hypothetical protein
MKNVLKITLPLFVLAFGVLLSGCYTQLAVTEREGDEEYASSDSVSVMSVIVIPIMTMMITVMHGSACRSIIFIRRITVHGSPIIIIHTTMIIIGDSAVHGGIIRTIHTEDTARIPIGDLDTIGGINHTTPILIIPDTMSIHRSIAEERGHRVHQEILHQAGHAHGIFMLVQQPEKGFR